MPRSYPSKGETNMEQLPPVMTMREVAEYLRVHPTTVYRLLRRGVLPAFRVGSDWRFSRAALDAWMLNHTVANNSAG